VNRLAANRASAVALVILTALLGAVACSLTLGFGGDSVHQFILKWLFSGVIIAAGLLTMARAGRAGRERVAWLLIGLAVVLWGVGLEYWELVLSTSESPPYPSVSDFFWLAFYPPCYVGLALLLRSRLAEVRASLWLDGVIAALALAALGSAIVFGAVLEVTGGSAAAVATNLAYPLADLVLIGLVVATLAASGWRPGRAWGLIAAGLALFAVGDSIYLYQVAVGSYVEGTLYDLGWISAAVLIAWAAWQPSVAITRTVRDGWWVLVPPIGFALVGLGLLVYDHFARITPLALVVATVALLGVLVRLAMTFGENLRMLSGTRREARTDALTKLGNRRKLIEDMDRAFAEQRKHLLVLFDLNGFKLYNDSFGHPAGDALLTRLARNLEASVGENGCAYRMGGDEFCVLLDDALPELLFDAEAAMCERGDGFSITTAFGAASIPEEASTVPDALRLVDQRLYAQKSGMRGSAGEQSLSALAQVLAERDPGLGIQVEGVADLAERVARQLGIDGTDLRDICAAAALHDMGKISIPAAILSKPGPLDENEWLFVRRHPVVGERIVGAAPALASAAKLVRSTHERMDGGGYPDGLEGDEIPLGARIVTVCDAFVAMTSPRPYAAERGAEDALVELYRCSGTQFDRHVVDALALGLSTRTGTPASSRPGPAPLGDAG
jgi:two-component system cell cycle response regulator